MSCWDVKSALGTLLPSSSDRSLTLSCFSCFGNRNVDKMLKCLVWNIFSLSAVLFMDKRLYNLMWNDTFSALSQVTDCRVSCTCYWLACDCWRLACLLPCWIQPELDQLITVCSSYCHSPSRRTLLVFVIVAGIFSQWKRQWNLFSSLSHIIISLRMALRILMWRIFQTFCFGEVLLRLKENCRKNLFSLMWHPVSCSAVWG